jgi:hypothetical protein
MYFYNKKRKKREEGKNVSVGSEEGGLRKDNS